MASPFWAEETPAPIRMRRDVTPLLARTGHREGSLVYPPKAD
jgi:hypothetical protein